jgi:hypothetical protein
MKIGRLLEEKSGVILDRAERGIRTACLRDYQDAGGDEIRSRLGAIYDVVLACISERDLAPVIEHAEGIARERFVSGFGLYEVQSAFNALEEAIWLEILSSLGTGELEEALTMVSAALGMGKDAFARAYVSLAAEAGRGSG